MITVAVPTTAARLAAARTGDFHRRQRGLDFADLHVRFDFLDIAGVLPRELEGFFADGFHVEHDVAVLVDDLLRVFRRVYARVDARGSLVVSLPALLLGGFLAREA